jgi:hypothetical protein
MRDEDELSVGRWTLIALQVLAMALCVVICAQIWTVELLHIPREMCIQGEPPQ